MLELGIRVVISLGVVLGIFWTMARLGARKHGGRDRTLIRVRSRQGLSRGSSLAVVEVGSRVLVVGVSDAGIRLLTELDPFELDTDASELTELPDAVPGAVAVAPAKPQRALPRHAATPDPSALGGSLLAPATWRQAWSAATGRSTVGTVSVPGGSE